MKQIKVCRDAINRITWTDEHTLLKEGNLIRFKGEEIFWNIKEIYDKNLDKQEINRTWHVGGL